MTNRWIFGLLMVLLITAAGCARYQTVDDRVYHDLGGQPGVERLTTKLLDYVYADERISFLFKDTDRPHLETLIVEQICMETGGGCEYTGLPMDEGHGGLNIGQHEFDAFVEDFILAMEELEIDTRTQNRVLAIFAPMRRDIINR